MTLAGPHPNSARIMLRTSGSLLLLAMLCLPWADLSITTLSPGLELGRLLTGLLTPAWPSTATLVSSMLNTLSFALQGVALATVLGLAMALSYRRPWVRRLATSLRAIHELFWALIFIQITGLTPLTGVLAIAIPYAGIFAKVYGELFEEADPEPGQALPRAASGLSRLIYTTLPLALPQMLAYTKYRLECGIRSSAVLGFIGLPTLGFHLESLLRQGFYSEAAAYFYALLLLIATLQFWCRRRLMPLYLAGALIWLPPVASVSSNLIGQFFTHDIIPAPLRSGFNGSDLLIWLLDLGRTQVWPGVRNTLILALLALVVMGAVGLLTFPGASRLFGNRATRGGWRLTLIILRSLPEYLLAFIALIILGPSMLPAILALGVHNGAIVGHLLGQYSDRVLLREDASRGINRYLFEVLPRQFRLFLAISLYRFETVIRETAILGMLGIPTLGFFIDSAFAEFRLDRALLLLLASAGLNIGVDAGARRLRRFLHLNQHVHLC